MEFCVSSERKTEIIEDMEKRYSREAILLKQGKHHKCADNEMTGVTCRERVQIVGNMSEFQVCGMFCCPPLLS